MPDFKIGDKVRRIKSEHGGMQVNDIGTVKFVTSSGAIELQERAYNVKMWDNTFNVTHDADNFELVESPARHCHADTIIAWANGAKIQFLQGVGETSKWIDLVGNPVWAKNITYRVKPTPRPDVERRICLSYDKIAGPVIAYERPNVKAMFDGETGELKGICKL